MAVGGTASGGGYRKISGAASYYQMGDDRSPTAIPRRDNAAIATELAPSLARYPA